MLSKALGSRTVMSGSISKSKNDPSESLQMMERPLMTADELKSIPKGSFVVMKTGIHPLQTRLRLYLDWGITFGKPYILPEKSAREVAYADKLSLTWSITERYPGSQPPDPPLKDREAPKSGRTARPTHTGKKASEPEVTEGSPTPYNTSGGDG